MGIRGAIDQITGLFHKIKRNPELLTDGETRKQSLLRLKHKMMHRSEPITRQNVRCFLDKLEDAADDRAFAGLLSAHSFRPTISFDQLSPDSPEFFALQMQQYRDISGRDGYFPIRDERDSGFEFANQFTVYPFTTQDPVCTGYYLIGVGMVLKAMQLKPGATIVEYGIGWGHTTLALAQLGYNVIAVDIEEKFLTLVEHRAKQLGLTITTHHGEFGELPSHVETIDGALFFECFHHCLNHVEVVKKLSDRLNPGGRLILAGEPLFDEDWFYPWGLRLDGQSVWAIGTHGWMELGFKRSYLETLLRSSGFELERHYHPEFGCVGEVYVGIKKA
jgi:2-polyprenyl-3-methyl-5-hydroxy-6-metoxy-1,4-benzoquinol methylase